MLPKSGPAASGGSTDVRCYAKKGSTVSWPCLVSRIDDEGIEVFSCSLIRYHTLAKNRRDPSRCYDFSWEFKISRVSFKRFIKDLKRLRGSGKTLRRSREVQGTFRKSWSEPIVSCPGDFLSIRRGATRMRVGCVESDSTETTQEASPGHLKFSNL